MPVTPRGRPRVIGGSPVEFASCSFTTSGSTAGITASTCYGCSVSRTGVGLFTVVLDRQYRDVDIGLSFTSFTSAQLYKINSNDGKTIVVGKVNAGGSTQTDTAIGTVDLIMLCRG